MACVLFRRHIWPGRIVKTGMGRTLTPKTAANAAEPLGARRSQATAASQSDGSMRGLSSRMSGKAMSERACAEQLRVGSPTPGFTTPGFTTPGFTTKAQRAPRS
jgi:hypothetical protein